jgi:acyl-CoA synthetase
MKPILTLHTPAKARSYYGYGLWTTDTFYSLLARHAEERPGAWAVRDSARRLTWAELLGRTDDMAARLHAAGLRPGDRVSLWMSSRIEAVIGFLACARNGYICNPSLHQNYTVDEIVTLLGRIRAAGLIAEEGYGADAAHKDPFGPISALEDMKKVIRLPAGRSESSDLAEPAPGAPPARADDPDAVAYLAFTSGTTGMPKGVMHSANTLMANGRDMVRDWGHDNSTVLLSLSPVSHHIAWVGLGQALTAGAEFVVNDPPAGMKPLDWIIETGATYVMGVPTHAMDIQAEQRRRGLERIGDVTVFYMAGAAIPPAVAENFLKQGIKPQNVYGMSENSSHQYTQPDDDAATIVNTCGRGGKAYEIAIFDMDDADKPATRGTVGQIGGQGACLMLGYFGNQQATEDSFNKGGWFLSGDLGRIDENGNLEVAGRLKDMIIRGGKNIYPAKIDDLAVKHPGVDKAAAFPVPDERLGEKVCLAILPHGDMAPTAEEMLDHLHRAGLSKYDMPEYFIVMPVLPMTASGKILKRELAAWAKSGDIAPQPCRFVDPAKKAS